VITARCPACGSGSAEDMGSVGPVPVLCGSLWGSREQAMATPTASLDLAVCHRCAHVWNTTFDPDVVDYDAKYDNALDFSPTFRKYADALARRLVDTYGLRQKSLVEIGSGKGDFLRLLCSLGESRGLGYDPTYVGPPVEGGITYLPAYFTPSTTTGDHDFVACRHVLEHLPDPYAFLSSIRSAVGHQPVPMYFEVPNAEFNFAESGPWDLIYPHVAYFNERSLRALLNRAGFRVLRLEPCFDGQFLGADVVPDPAVREYFLPTMNGRVPGGGVHRSLRRQMGEVLAWRQKLDDLAGRGPVALWGAGSKGVTFLSLLDRERKVGAVVDANPRKWGRFLPGVGHQVVSPEVLVEQWAQTVLVMNPAYAHEIAAAVREMGCPARIESA
jgi:hypothetical protein